VHDPNGLPDLLPENDTLCKTFTVIDTSVYSTVAIRDSLGNIIRDGSGYCTTFEDTAQVKWISYNPYPDANNISRTQDDQETFVRAIPRKNLIRNAVSGNKVWMTRDSANYQNVDSAGLLSPFFRLSLDSCYRVSFWNNYVIRDRFNDGGQLQISGNLGRSWSTIYYDERDSVSYNDTTVALIGSFQKNWHNAKNIKAIPNNLTNSGWTGYSGGWVLSENIFGGDTIFTNRSNPFNISTNDTLDPINFIGSTREYFAVFHFRFESDATVTDEGMAIDDFCLETIDKDICSAVGLNEQFDRPQEDLVYVGQNIPNPARLTTSIPYYLPTNADVSVRVVNVMGQLMYDQAERGMAKGSGYIDIDISNYAQGVYYYTVVVDGKPYSKKMIVTK
jgi:hypothetical protein